MVFPLTWWNTEGLYTLQRKQNIYLFIPGCIKNGEDISYFKGKLNSRTPGKSNRVIYHTHKLHKCCERLQVNQVDYLVNLNQKWPTLHLFGILTTLLYYFDQTQLIVPVSRVQLHRLNLFIMVYMVNGLLSGVADPCLQSSYLFV